MVYCLGFLEEFVVIHSLKFFQRDVQIEFPALYWILGHGWVLRR